MSLMIKCDGKACVNLTDASAFGWHTVRIDGKEYYVCCQGCAQTVVDQKWPVPVEKTTSPTDATNAVDVLLKQIAHIGGDYSSNIGALCRDLVKLVESLRAELRNRA